MLRRRHFLIGAAGLAGGVGALTIAWGVQPLRQRQKTTQSLAVSDGQVALNGWVKVSPDNSITVMMSQVEMGQGVHTALAMILAEEMDAEWGQVRIEQAPIDLIYNNLAMPAEGLLFQPQDDRLVARASRHFMGRLVGGMPGMIMTGGSSSINDQWQPLREAGATARHLLVAAAAVSWNVAASECQAENGAVKHPSGKTASFGELAAHAEEMPLPKKAVLKNPGQFKIIGQPLRRIERGSKQAGTAVFGIDVLPQDLIYASVSLCPTLGGKLAGFDDSAARSLPGFRKVVTLDPIASPGFGNYGAGSGGFAVIADTPFHAMRGVDAVKPQWDHGPGSGVSSQEVIDGMIRELDKKGDTHLRRGNVEVAFASAARCLTADYRVPYLAHATMEPMNCTIQFQDGAATLWVGTQAPAAARMTAAKVLGIDAERVTLVIPYLGGGFGRRGCLDMVSQAAALAREVEGRPVQLLWSREQDMTHDYYRSAFVARAKAGLDEQGRLVAWRMDTAGSSMGAPSFIDNAVKGMFDSGYAFANALVVHRPVDTSIPIGSWRSVMHSYNAFFKECFIDEIAAAAGQDPVKLRLSLLRDNPYLARVLMRVAELSNWEQPLEPTRDGPPRARGVAIHQAFGSAVAQVAEVSVAKDRQIHVHKITSVIDCGLPVNPNLIRQQIEGGAIFGLSAALQGEITIENGQVQQTNFDTFEPLRMSACPAFETDIIASTNHPTGVGELGVPAIAPAVANAVFAATGQRLRALPLRLV